MAEPKYNTDALSKQIVKKTQGQVTGWIPLVHTSTGKRIEVRFPQWTSGRLQMRNGQIKVEYRFTPQGHARPAQISVGNNPSVDEVVTALWKGTKLHSKPKAIMPPPPEEEEEEEEESEEEEEAQGPTVYEEVLRDMAQERHLPYAKVHQAFPPGEEEPPENIDETLEDLHHEELLQWIDPKTLSKVVRLCQKTQKNKSRVSIYNQSKQLMGYAYRMDQVLWKLQQKCEETNGHQTMIVGSKFGNVIVKPLNVVREEGEVEQSRLPPKMQAKKPVARKYTLPAMQDLQQQAQLMSKRLAKRNQKA
jgi:hypothetical protein